MPQTRLVSPLNNINQLFCPTLIRNDSMPLGRPTTDPKGESIRIRISEDMRIKLEKESSRTGQNISQIIRNLISKHLN